MRTEPADMLRKISRMILAMFFTAAGVNHFLSPDLYIPLIPGYLPWPHGLVFLSGVAEVVGGVGIVFPKTRRLAGWWLIAVLVAVFPANVHMLMDGVPVAGKSVPGWLLWARLPLQVVLIAWVYIASIRQPGKPGLENRNHEIPETHES